MKKSINVVNKDHDKLRQENKKLKEEYEKYKETMNEKLKDLELLISQNEKLRKENDELKKKLSKINGGNNTSQNMSSKSLDKLKTDLHNKEATISLISKQKDFLISIITRITNLNSKNKFNKGKILSQLEEKNIDKEKDKEKLTNEIISVIKEEKKDFINNKYYIRHLSKDNFSLEILPKKNSKIIGSKNSKGNYSCLNGGGGDKNNYKKEVEIIRKLNDMLAIIKKKKDLLKSKKNNLSFRIGTIKEGK